MIGAPQLLKNEFKIAGKTFTRKSDERAMMIWDEYNRYRDATEVDIEREFENLDFFYGLDGRQWRTEAKNQMEDEDRPLGTYNLVQRKVSGIAGSLIRNPFDTKYIGDTPSLDHLTQILQQMYLSDRELMDWDSELHQGIIYGLSYRTCFWMRVETDLPASPIGNIAIRHLLPGTWIADPAWKSLSSKSLSTLYRFHYMRAKDLKQTYKTKSGEIQNEIDFQNRYGEYFEKDEDVDWSQDATTSKGDSFLVVEKHYLDVERVTREFDPATGTIFWEWMDDEEKVSVAQKLDIPPERIREEKVNSKIYKVAAMAPDFPNLILEDGKHFCQIGRLPFFPWASQWVNGKPVGIVDQLKDAQREINERQATITLGAQGAVNTGVAMDPAMFGNDETKISEFKKHFGNPRQIARLKSGASRQFPNGLTPLARAAIAPELFAIVNDMIQLMDILVPQPAAGEAQSKSGESGILFAQKLEVMKTLQTPMMFSYRQLIEDIGEAYLYYASKLYSKGMRTFSTGDGKDSFEINVPALDDLTGEEIVENDFSEIASVRHRLQLAESPKGVNIRLINRELNMGILGTWPRDSMPNTGMVFAENVVRSLDMTEEEKESASKAIELDKRLIESNTEAQIKQNESLTAQLPQQAVGGEQQALEIPGTGIPEPALGGTSEGATVS